MQSSWLLILIGLAIGAILGGIVGWLVAAARVKELIEVNRELRQRETNFASIEKELREVIEEKGRLQGKTELLDKVSQELKEKDAVVKALDNKIASLEKELAVAKSSADHARERAEETVKLEREAQKKVTEAKDGEIASLNQFIAQAKGALRDEFKALSGEVLQQTSNSLVSTADLLIKQHGERVTTNVELHKQEIKTLLQPVEQSIRNLDQHVSDSSASRQNAETLLNNQIDRLAGASESLSTALRKPVIRGSWGEIELEGTLENAGLEPEVDFILQHSTDGEDGRKRTDAIINLPKGRKLIVDSKNLMDSYVKLMSAGNDLERSQWAEKHSQSLRGHLRDLSSKEYWKRYDSLDCVILFIPHDGMYHAAIKDEADLIREASNKRVFIANPMSLIPLLKAIRYVLDQERLNKSAKEISDIGTKLYEDITRFAGRMATIGSKLNAAVDAYNKAIPSLDRNIISKSRKLKKLGAAKGPEPRKIEEIREGEVNHFASRELRPVNLFLEEGSSSMDFVAASLEEDINPEHEVEEI
jgi:DNA recombination protein RmuC